MHNRVILGAGVTGLGAGLVSGMPIYEAAATPGGICSSYYTIGDGNRASERTSNEEDYRFETGGGHWIFGGNDEVTSVFRRYDTFITSHRRSSVYLPALDISVPYPLQDHVSHLPASIAEQALSEWDTRQQHTSHTLDAWLRHSFGETLYTLFFRPFHDLYTAGFYRRIAPQDAYKTPPPSRETSTSVKGVVSDRGYNAQFLYPQHGLNHLLGGIAGDCTIRYGMRAVRIDTATKTLVFENGETIRFETLLSTIPLHDAIRLAGLDTGVQPDPYTSVLVLNVAGVRGASCPDVHWMYVPESRGGFHRIGFYDTVRRDFLPRSLRSHPSEAALYIEKAYPGGYEPSSDEIAEFTGNVTEQLREWGILDRVHFADPTFIRTAYTWRWPQSEWRERAIATLAKHGIHQTGRFAQWKFQGIAASFMEGMQAGNRLSGTDTV